MRGNPLLHAVDRYVGIPILALGGAVRRARPRPEEVRRVGAINSTNIGDTILLSAVLSDLSAAFPEAETILFTSEAVLPIAGLFRGVRAEPLEIGNPRQAIRKLRHEQLDILLDFDQWPRIEPVYCLLSGAHWTAGFRSPHQHRHYSYDAAVNHSSSQHEIDNYRDLAGLLGIQSRSIPRLKAPGVLDPRRMPPWPYVLLHMWPTGVRSELKEWPADRWLRLAGELAGGGYAIVLSGAAGDAARTKAFAQSCRVMAKPPLDFSGTCDLAELVDLAAGSACVISVNTGVAHLAAATGTPTVVLNGPTSERRWGPIGDRAVSINSKYPGCGYLHFGWEYKGRREDCMLGISVDEVLEVVALSCEQDHRRRRAAGESR
ncbi:MAG: glycosyltransferase family 9 protein [Actinomycetota bacterium]|nr:glycosyltransferase family 9 protein [Actinomycetota bacterium]